MGSEQGLWYYGLELGCGQASLGSWYKVAFIYRNTSTWEPVPFPPEGLWRTLM